MQPPAAMIFSNFTLLFDQFIIENFFLPVLVGLLHHCYMCYSNAKCDPLSLVVLFLSKVPPTLFSVLLLFKS